MSDQIYEMLYKFKRATGKATIILLFAIFGTIGVAVLIYCSVQRKNDNAFFDRAIPISATICEIKIYESKDSNGNIRREHQVYIDYEVNAQSYTHIYAGEKKPGMSEGDQIEVFYDPNNPDDARMYYDVDSKYNDLSIIAIFFIVVSSLPLMASLLLKFAGNKNRDLIDKGRCVWATIKSIETNYYKSVNGEHPNWVICEEINEEEDTIYRYISHQVYEDLTYRLKPGDHIAIYVDYKNPDRYYVNFDQVM